MKLVSFLNRKKAKDKRSHAGILLEDRVLDLQMTMNEFLVGGLKVKSKKYLPLKEVKLLAPVPHPPSCRDAYAFRQHVASARRNRGMDMIPQFDQYPIFYFTNHTAIVGEGKVSVEKDHLEKLDFELEVACVIGKKGKNIESKDADRYIAGFTIMNDFSARQLQMEEMLLSLGPAKGKDFATALGPWLVTPDELEAYKIKTSFGNKYDLWMKATHNGKQVSEGNMKDMNWTFAEIIERCSYGVELQPGDVIGSGTVGTGCYMELNGTWALKAKEKGESFTPIWLKAGDTIELEVAGLGKLKNTIVKTPKDYSILAKKKLP
ncbi:MAG: fumarylacetoacetate hydrolase family protein [Deltaproteobacteria bacterium]|nr:fumarylacetoacetate hydrolase family protein [Deltaproteobacteria bacterium]